MVDVVEAVTSARQWLSTLSSEALSVALSYAQSHRERAVIVTALCLVTARWLFCKRRKPPAKRSKPAISSAAGKQAVGSVSSEELQRKLEEFRQQCRRALAVGSALEESAETALDFVTALCDGVGPYLSSLHIDANGTLHAKSRAPLNGEFATRSRIAFSLRSPSGFSFRVNKQPPDSDCPHRCECHKRCFGPQSGGSKPWAELVLESPESAAGGGKVSPLAAAVQVFPVDVTVMEGCKVVQVLKNDFKAVDVKGNVVVLTEKDKGDRISDGWLCQEAKREGAVGVIKIGGDGIPCRVPDPMEIPCIQLSGPDARTFEKMLENAADARQPLRVVKIREYDLREELRKERWNRPAVWVHMEGLRFRTLDFERPYCKDVKIWKNSDGVVSYEDFSELLHDPSRTCFKPEDSKVSRILHSYIKNLDRLGVTSNYAQLGKMIALMAYQQWECKAPYARFQPAREHKGVTCAILLADATSSASDSAPSAEISWAHWAHECVFVVLLGFWGTMIGKFATSTWNFVKCLNAEYFDWECDAKKIVKLFSPCTGPVGPEGKEAWQQADPTWRIVDETRMGMTVQTQGRMLWSQEAGAEGASPASVAKKAQAAKVASGSSLGCAAGLFACLPKR